MDQKIVYSKTGKGVLEIKSNARKLSRELAKVLSQVDGKSAVADLGAKSKLNEANLARCLKQLEEEGYIKEFAGLSSGMKSSASAGGASSYVDDLDFTSALSPGKAVYSNAQTEFRASESADRKRAEAEATRNRKAKEEKKRQEAKTQARKEVARMARVEAERKAKEATAIKARKQAELDEKRMAAEMAKTTRDLAEILEVERRALEKTEGRRPAATPTRSVGIGGSKGIDVDLRKREEEILRRYQEEQGRKQDPKAAKPGAPTTVANEEEDKRKREELEKRKREEEEKRKREEEDKRKREEEERRKREEEDKRKREEEERRKREEEDKRKREEEERRKREEEDKRKREEEERRKREEEDKRKREEEERRKREEEERRKREEEEKRKREEEKRKREEEEKRKREEEEKRKREEEERRKREEEERLRREEEDRRREEEDRRREEEERRRREEEEQREREEKERREREEEEQRKRDEEESRKREEEEQRKGEKQERRKQEMAEFRKQQKAELERLEKEKREREQENLDVPTFDIDTFEAMTESESAGEDSSANLELPSLLPESDDAFSLDFDKQQEELAKQAAEEERRIQEAEEARLAMERAAREEEARAEAERRSAIEAEMRARVEQEKEERAERENHKREEYKRKIEETEERKRAAQEKKLQEEQQRIDADRKRREDDLIRRREEAEEAGRKARELKALKRSGKVRSPVERVVAMATGVIVILAMAVGVLHVMPMSGYVPSLERLASNNIGEPVSIGSMKVSLLSGLQFKLSNVSIGSTQDVILNDVAVTPKLGSIFGDQLVIESIEANGGRIVKEALSRLPLWQDTSALDTRMHVQSISLRGITPEMRAFKLPSVNVDVKFGQIGQVRSARIETTNGKLYATITSGGSSGKGVTIGASDWTPPFGTPITITDFLGTGTFTGSALNLSEWDATVYGGQAKGAARISWNSGWRATAQFEFVRIVTEDLLAAFTKTAKASGTASGTAAFSARSGSLHTLLDNPTLQASFLVKKGNLDGVDLVRALQVGSAGSQGGSTKFQELSGDVTISNGRFNYKNVNLSAGILSASSSFNIATNQAVSGQVTVALRSSVQRLTANLNVTGSLKGVLLRP